MNDIESQFVSYEIALALKELGFDEKCIGQENNKLRIQQFSLNGELLKIWSSISIAAKETKSSKSSIIRCCKNKQKTCNNFIWKYLNN